LDEFRQRKRRFGGQSNSDERLIEPDVNTRLNNGGVKIA
jgi:hypothetical protein